MGFDASQRVSSWLSGGGAHKNFRVRMAGTQAVLKIWNTMWEGVGVMPPSAVIMSNTKIAGELGIGASVLGISQEPRALLMEFIPSTQMDRSGTAWTGKLAGAVRSLHDSPQRFNNDYSPFNEARRMLAAARHRDAVLPDRINEIHAEIDKIERVLDLRFNEFVPCHNDLYGPNILQTPNGTLRLIDYDLAGNGDRCYDLGFASAYFEMNEDMIHRFCEQYFGENDEHLVARVRLFSAAADWSALALWSVAATMADTNDDYDYAGEQNSSLRRLSSVLDAPWYASAIAKARR
jgi:thiamine kinase-like enzyme